MPSVERAVEKNSSHDVFGKFIDIIKTLLKFVKPLHIMNLIKNGCFETPNVTLPPYVNPNHPNWNEYVPLAAVAPWETSAPTFELWHNPTVVNNRPPCYSAPPCKQNCEILSHGAGSNPLLQASV